MSQVSSEKFKPEMHTKGWGYEKWIFNSTAYCGKILFFEKDKKCSWHYHKIKDEVFYLQSGVILLKYSWEDEISTASEVILKPGDSFHVPQGLRHQMLAIAEAELFEISTTHFESDSIRVIKGD
jgi:mannose-6-phosphate isomerase-like protein (cupin superfamily)